MCTGIVVLQAVLAMCCAILGLPSDNVWVPLLLILLSFIGGMDGWMMDGWAGGLRDASVRLGTIRAIFAAALDLLPDIGIVLLVALGAWRVFRTARCSPGQRRGLHAAHVRERGRLRGRG